MQIMNLIISQPLSMLLFNIPCGKTASQLKAILLCLIVWVTS